MKLETRAKVIIYRIAGVLPPLAQYIARRQGILNNGPISDLQEHYRRTAQTIVKLDQWNHRRRSTWPPPFSSGL